MNTRISSTPSVKQRTAITAMLAALSLVISACNSDGGGSSGSSSPTTTTTTTVPGAPTIGAITAGDANASIAFTAPASTGGSTITGYTATCTAGSTSKTGTGSASPLAVSGLTNATAYSCSVTATNAVGTSAASSTATVTPVAAATAPGAPTIGTITAGDASATITFTASSSTGSSAITSYTATCIASGTSKTGAATTSPIIVSGLTNGTAYSCTMTATNAAGTSVASGALSVTPTLATSGSSLNAAYKNVKWQTGVTVTFPTDCTMTYTSKGVPSHTTDTYYLEPVRDVGGAVVATTAASGMQLGTAAFGGTASSTTSMSQTFNTCPTKAATTTATSGGPIGWMISGSAMFNATEGANSPTPALTDNVSYTFTDASGVSRTAKFIDNCNGHPTPIMNTYHYHGVPACVTALVDTTAAASHIIGIANDGFPIYGGRDISGNVITVAQLDACNGITSTTPEFPNGIYHYVLPEGVTSFRSSLGCYSGTVSKQAMLAAALVNGMCYGARPPASGELPVKSLPKSLASNSNAMSVVRLSRL